MARAWFLSGGKTRAPWLVVRRALAKEWGVPPWEVDTMRDEHPDEVGRALELLALEAQSQPGDGPGAAAGARPGPEFPTAGR